MPEVSSRRALGSVAFSPRRRRSRRLRIAGRCSAAAVVAGGVFAYTMKPAEAAWTAMLTQVLAQINEAIDIWEKHTRQLEDVMDQAAGVMAPFNELYAGFRELTDLNGLKAVARLGQTYKADMQDPSCFLPHDFPGSRNCTLSGEVSIFVPQDVRDLYHSTSNFQYAAGRQYGHFEGLLQSGTIGQAYGYLQAIFPDPANRPPWLNDAMGQFEAVTATIDRIRWNKQRHQLANRRMRFLSGRFQAAANQVLRYSSGGDSAAARAARAADPNYDYAAERRWNNPDDGGGAGGQGGGAYRSSTGDFRCGAGSASSMVTGTAAAAHEPTVLAQSVEVDCLGGAAADGSPHDPLTPGAHLSGAEAEALQVQALIVTGNLAAAELEKHIYDFAEEIYAELAAHQARQAAVLRAERRLAGPCPTLADSAGNCPANHAVTSTQAAERAAAAFGVDEPISALAPGIIPG